MNGESETRYYVARYRDDGATQFWDGRYGWVEASDESWRDKAWCTTDQHAAKPVADARHAKVHPVKASVGDVT